MALGACLLAQLVVHDVRAPLAFVALFSLPLSAFAAQRSPAAALVGASASGLSACGLALLDPETWIGLSLPLVAVVAFGWLGQRYATRHAALALALGVLGPLLFGAAIATFSAGGLRVLLGAFGDRSDGWAQLYRGARWLSLAVALVAAASLAGKPARFVAGLAALALSLLLVPRVVWLVTRSTLPNDTLVWSEAPILLNLWKLRVGEVFYGPFAGLRSYSYSPTLELVQYTLLRPFGLELSLGAHRALGMVWLVAAASWLALMLRRWVGGGSWVSMGVGLGCLGLLLSSLLAPHLHPDHLLMLCACLGYWLVGAEPRALRLRRLLLVLLPVAATSFKLTGAGLGVGLALAYAWERDFRSVAWLSLGVFAGLATIPLYDATLGSFSAYTIGLQASHPFDWERARLVGLTPPLLLCGVAAVICAWRVREQPGAPATRAAVRILLVTVGIGATSLVAYAKHGGRENSLLPFTLGGAAALAVTLCAFADAREADSEPEPAWRLLPLLSVVIAVVMPFAEPVLGRARAELVGMHAASVAWLEKWEQGERHVFSPSTAAYLAAAYQRLPDASLATISELELGGRPEVRLFEDRVRRGHYDGLLLPASTLRLNTTFVRLGAELRANYAVVAPPELAGAWPSGLAGYVILERRAQAGSARDIR